MVRRADPPTPEPLAPELLGAVTAHELREPLHAIQSFLSILLHERAGPLNALQADFLATAKRASHRLERLIDDVQIALNGGSTLHLRPELIDLSDHVRRCCQELIPYAADHGVRLAVEAETTMTAPCIRADPQRVDQILLNLIENAIRYASPNTEVLVAGWRGPGGAGAVTITNCVDFDAGREAERWFQPYQRGTNAKAQNGYGLGLAIATHLVRAHGGEIMIAAKERQVRVGFVLPRVPLRGQHDAIDR